MNDVTTSAIDLDAFLNCIEAHSNQEIQSFRLPVQSVDNSASGATGINGTVASGSIEVGMSAVASLSGKSSIIKQIMGPSGELKRAETGHTVSMFLADDIDIKQGDVLAEKGKEPDVADQFAAHLIWMDKEAMLPERTYIIRIATAMATVQVTDLVHQIDVNTRGKLAAKKLHKNEIGYCKLALDQAVAFDTYANNDQTGIFELFDKFTEAKVAFGVIDFALRRASNIEWHDMKIDKKVRAQINQQTPCLLWFTGLSGSGKSTIADRLEQKLHALGKRTYLLDGDNVRHGLNKDLGFTDQDRVENIRRIGEVSKLMVDAGLIVISSFISPFRSERQMARSQMDENNEFIEIFVNTPIEICEERDPKGLYKKARAGDLKNFTGIDSDYEIPENAEIVLKAGHGNPDDLADQIIDYLSSKSL